MKYKALLFFALFITSCIPVSLAPDFQKKGYKVKEARRFKRVLPKQQAFIFVDSKEEGEFYSFINNKYELFDIDVDLEVPFRINDQLYYLSFYEVEKTTSLIDIFAITDEFIHEFGTYYIVITVTDNDEKDCLNPSHINRNMILQYLKDLKQEYLNLKVFDKSQ